MSKPSMFVSRAGWGSTFNYRSNTLMPDAPRGTALHWEGTGLGEFEHSECDNKVRSIERFHVQKRGWAGIAYNALVCPHGYIFEGRGVEYRSAANGDEPQNNAYFAVCYLGGPGDPFTDLAKDAYIRAVQWLVADGNAGDEVVGHRDLTSTSCPGSAIYAWLKTTDFEDGGAVVPPKPPTTAVWGKPETWKIGSVGPDVTRLGERLVIWAKYYGLPKPYQVGPGPVFTEVDRKAVEAFQRKQGWTGADADGYPGPETFKRLAADPPKPPAPSKPPLRILHQNVAGSDVVNGFGARNGTRGPAVGAYLREIGFDVLLTCEAGQSNLRKGITKGLGTSRGGTEWEQRAKALWFNPTTVKNIAARKVYSADGFSYLSSRKWGAGFFGEHGDKKFSVLEVHLDYRKPANQSKQLQTIFKKWRKDTDRMGISHLNCFVVGDFNKDGTSDDPFKALAPWNIEEKGSRTVPTFMERKHLDGLLAHKSAKVKVSVFSRRNLSDHNPVLGVAELV